MIPRLIYSYRTAYVLSMHSDVQSRLRDEIRQHFPDAGMASLDANTLDSMEYLGAVCEEVLRLYPTVPVTARQAVRETTIGDQVVPKGTFVIMCPVSADSHKPCTA